VHCGLFLFKARLKASAAARDGNVKQVILNKVGGAITADLRTPAQMYSRTVLHAVLQPGGWWGGGRYLGLP